MRECSIGTLTFRVYSESADKRYVGVEVVADDVETGNIDCSLREWHALQDASVSAKALDDATAMLAKVVTGGNPTGQEWQRINELIRRHVR